MSTVRRVERKVLSKKYGNRMLSSIYRDRRIPYRTKHKKISKLISSVSIAIILALILLPFMWL